MLIGQNIIRLDLVDSTNNYAASMMNQGIIGHGAVILADEQTAGRGQRGAEWHAEAGLNLLLSICLKPDNLSVDQQFLLTQLVSVSLVELLKQHAISAKIKWPNDIYVGKQKIAGILIENSIASNSISAAVIGIGLNVNQTEFGQLNATSIKQLNHKHCVLNDVLMQLLDVMNQQYDLLKRQDYNALKRAYESLMFQKNELCRYAEQNQEIDGIIKGVTNEGRLIVEVDEQLKTYDLKEITFIL